VVTLAPREEHGRWNTRTRFANYTFVGDTKVDSGVGVSQSMTSMISIQSGSFSAS